MSSTSFSQQSPPPKSVAEPAATPLRIKLTVKSLKSKSTAPTSDDGPNNASTESTHASSHARTPITLKIKPSRLNTSTETPSSGAQSVEKKHLPRLILKPPKSAPAPVDDGNAMEVDNTAPQVTQVSPREEPAKEEIPVEILEAPSPPTLEHSQPVPPAKVKPPRPIKLKPLKEVLRILITRIKKKDDYAFFLNPVDTSQVAGYLDVIKQPMDFGTMTEKIEKGQYRSLEQFKDDFLLVIANAKLFNPPPSIYYSEASKIESWGLEQISKATVQVIEYEADWTIDVVEDGGSAPAAAVGNDVDNAAAEFAMASGEVPSKTRSPSVMSSAVGTPNLSSERSKRHRGKKVPIVTESWEERGHLPGFKDGIGVFPPCSDLAALILELKLKGKRFRTKKERLKREKEGPPLAADGSLDYTEMEHPFTILRQLVPKPLTVPEVVPLIPTRSAAVEAPSEAREVSQPPEGRRETQIDGPVALPIEAVSDVLSDPNRHVFVNPPPYTSVVGDKQLRHWTITRNPPRAVRSRDEDEEGSVAGPDTKRRRVEHVDYGSFAELLGTIAAENGLKADDFEEFFSSDSKVLDQIRQTIESRGPTSNFETLGKPDVEEQARLLDADEYIRDVVYGGVDGLAYFRSLAEFVGEYHGSLEEDHGISVPPGELGMPIAQWVARHIVNPLTLENHATLRAVAETLARAKVQEQDDPNAHASHAIVRYLELANEDKSSVQEQLRELQALAEPFAQIDIAPLLRKPEELFLAENEWVGRDREKAQTTPLACTTALDAIRSATISGAGAGSGAVLGLGLASALPGQNRLAGVLADERAGAIEYALNATAEALRDFGQQQGQDMKIEDGGTEDETEDTAMRRTRLTLIALAKRAPIDRIARLPPELVPIHIRHIVPTLGT
ncbi:hypothetical protein ACEPAG_2679 [Sanghuangporus baumii]